MDTMQEQSEHIDQIALALSKSQREMTHAKKDSMNPYFKSKYADLATVIDTCKESLGKHELSVAQHVKMFDGAWCLVTTLTHSSGQWFKSFFPILSKDATPQSYASAVSYARRYSLSALVGIAQEDDDAEAAMNRNGKQVSIPKIDERISADQVETLSNLFFQLERDQREDLLKWMKIKDLSQIKAENFQKAYDVIVKRMEVEHVA